MVVTTISLGDLQFGYDAKRKTTAYDINGYCVPPFSAHRKHLRLALKLG